MSNKIKVGFLPLYIKLYDDMNGPQKRVPMEKYMNTAISMLESFGIEVVMADQVCRIAPEFEAAAAKFNGENVDAVITMHLAYSPSLESIQAPELPADMVTTTPQFSRLSMMAW